MVNEKYSLSIIAFLLSLAAFQGLVVGEHAFDQFPSPGDSLDEDGIDSFLDLASLALDFIFWPFRVVNWFWNLASFQFIQGTPAWISTPFKIVVAAASAFAIIPIVLRVIDAIGQVAPFT